MNKILIIIILLGLVSCESRDTIKINSIYNKMKQNEIDKELQYINKKCLKLNNVFGDSKLEGFGKIDFSLSKFNNKLMKFNRINSYCDFKITQFDKNFNKQYRTTISINSRDYLFLIDLFKDIQKHIDKSIKDGILNHKIEEIENGKR